MTQNSRSIGKTILMALALPITTGVAFAQQAVLAAGGEATGAAGTVSFSVGQIDYITALGAGGTAQQGVQQPYSPPPACTTVWYQDTDGDGYGNAAVNYTGCTQPIGYAANNMDCNDGNDAINPGKTEIGNNGIDDNCDGTIDLPCPGPTGVNTSNITSSTVVVSWIGTVEATMYRVAYRIVGSGAWLTKNVAAPNTSTIISGLVPGSNYEWQLRSNSCSANGFALSSAWSGIQTFSTPEPSCGPITGLSSTNVGANSGQLNWILVSGVTKYTIFYRPVGSTTWLKKSNGATATSRILTGLIAGTTYEWRIDIKCADGTTAPSAVQNFTTGAPGRLADATSAEWAFTIHPNPSNGQFTITPLAEVEGLATVQLVDIAGRVILNQTWNASEDATLVLDKQLDLGLYVLTITAADRQQFSSRMVIAN